MILFFKFPQLYSKFGYRDITDQITILDSALAGTVRAYTENGVVLITVSLRAGKHGSITIARINTLYAPRTYVVGSYDCLASSADAQKVNSLRVNSEGEISVWIEQDLSYSERISFVYPLRW